MKKNIIIITTMLIMFSSVVYGKTFKLGSGGPTGNYFSMSNDEVRYCQESIGTDKQGNPNIIEVVNTSGSEENLMGLTNKKFAFAKVQEDVLWYHAKRSPNKINQNRMRVVLDMHIETGHLLFPKNWQPTNNEGGLFSKLWDKASNSKPESISVNLLKNQTIGSWGGSKISTEALNHFLGLKMKVVATNFNSAMKTADKPILLVGGQPYKVIEDLLNTGKYIMVGIDFNQLKSQAPFYVSMDANYKQNGKMVTVPTFGVRALLLGKVFRSKTKNQVMKDFANCLIDSLGDMSDDDDTNANWESVWELNKDNNRIDWRYFNKLKDNDDDE